MVSRAVTDINGNCLDPLQSWIQTGRWRKDYFEQDSQVREDFKRGKTPTLAAGSQIAQYNNPEYENPPGAKGQLHART